MKLIKIFLMVCFLVFVFIGAGFAVEGDINTVEIELISATDDSYRVSFTLTTATGTVGPFYFPLNGSPRVDYTLNFIMTSVMYPENTIIVCTASGDDLENIRIEHSPEPSNVGNTKYVLDYIKVKKESGDHFVEVKTLGNDAGVYQFKINGNILDDYWFNFFMSDFIANIGKVDADEHLTILPFNDDLIPEPIVDVKLKNEQ